MSPAHLLIIGRNGQVGWELCRTLAPLGNVTAVDYPEVNLAEPDSLRRCLDQHQPTILVNAAAYTAVDKAESEADLAGRINGDAPGVMADWAKSSGAWLVHYSTDYVFDGNKGLAYVETDLPNPLSAYGRSKLAGDEAVRAGTERHLIFRLCWVYGARGHNFLRTISRLAREQEKLRIVADQVGCPTSSRQIAEATALALARVLAAGQDLLAGTYHLAASTACSWHAFASAIVASQPESGRKCREVEAITTAEFPLPAARPACSILNCDRLWQTFGLRLPGWQEQLRLVLDT